jgi:hypothetical protein
LLGQTTISSKRSRRSMVGTVVTQQNYINPK